MRNRWLLNHLSRLGHRPFLHIAKGRDISIGLFSTLHTYGRQLTNNVHLHLSVTCGGLCNRHQVWKACRFNHYVIRSM